MNIYIRSATSINPRYDAGEPDYGTLIDARALRRMSRIIRMGVAAAQNCLRDAGIGVPDAIVTGTAYGCLQDTEVFLKSMIERKEDTLQPAPFIQSTHNTVGAQIALLLQCTGYNNTFVHRGFSFESALLDAVLLLKEGEANIVLAGAVDEVTETSRVILSMFRLYRDLPVGEGAAFFLLSGQRGEHDAARLEAIRTFYKPVDKQEIDRQVRLFADEHDLSGIDLVLGEPVLAGVETRAYKPLCGEYPSSTGFALWQAVQLIKAGGHRRILIYNDYLGIHHSLFLVSAI